MYILQHSVCVPVNDQVIGKLITYSSVFCYESALQITGMLLLCYDRNTKCVFLILFLSCTSYFAVCLHDHASSHCLLL